MNKYEENLHKYAGYLGSTDDYAAAGVVLLGVPMDYTVSFKPGARFGPLAVRNASYGLEEYSIEMDRSLSECRYADAGNVWIAPGNAEKSLALTEAAVAEIVRDGKIPFLLGGEHLVSLPAIQAVAARYPEVAVLHFDAHADLREEFCGEKNSHAAVFRRAYETVRPKHIFHFGIRSGDRAEIAFGREHSNLFLYDVIEPLRRVLPALAGRPVYVSLDIDVVDPAYAPGTGTPEPGGCTAREIIAAVQMIGRSGLSVVGFDLVEIAPDLDHAGITAMLGAKLVREALLSFA
ncbi:MAG: agmatinase [bacterium]|jgi:agmatinase